MRLGHCARQFKSRNCLLASDRGKALEKLVERIPGFEVVVQRLDGHPSTDKNRSAAEDLRVAVYDWRFVGHGYLQAFVECNAPGSGPSSHSPLHQPAADIVPWNRGVRPLNVLHPAPIQLRSLLGRRSNSPSRSASERLSHRAIASSARSPAGSSES